MGSKLTHAEGWRQDVPLLQCPANVLGDGAKMFTIAGLVIVYGVSASVVYGVIYWITTLF